MKHVATLFLGLLTLGAPKLSGQEPDPAAMIRSKDVAERLHAVSRIVSKGHPKAAELLTRACKDRDWEVVERAAAGLAKYGDDGSMKVLVALAVEGPLATIREAAARSLAAIDADAARKRLVRFIKGRAGARAARALAVVGFPGGRKSLGKLLKSDATEDRQAAVLALATTGDERAPIMLTELLRDDPDVSVRAAAAQAAARIGNDAALESLLGELARPKTSSVMQRRITDAITTLVANLEGEERDRAGKACLDAFRACRGGITAKAALARLVAALGAGTAPLFPREDCTRALLLATGDRPEGAIATALARLGGDEALTGIAQVAASGKTGLARRLALRAAVRHGGRRAREIAAKALATDKDAAVREEAAVACGRLLASESAPTLRSALSDDSWKVFLAAAVSLGILQDAEAVPLLVGHLTDESHLFRASAAAGLGRIARKDVVAPLITALDDEDPLVRETALDALQRITGSKTPLDSKKWAKWWDAHRDAFKFKDRLAERRRASIDDAKYDRFRQNPYGAFKGIRVIVLAQSRDKMERTLEQLGIEHVLTRTGKVSESGLHPNAVFLANCPGKLTNDDSERLDWFVRAGGHLFATCVAMTNTVMRTFPGVIRHPPASSNPPGGVDASPVPREAEYLDDVFGRHARPRFQIAGHQLPVPVDDDFVHVLVDSTDACTRWGAGSLAAWFSMGHGLVLDSANHFVLQGMVNERLKTADERRAFAIERLGIGFREIRRLDAKGVFKSKSKASKACRDKTMMRLVARFVFAKRRGL